MGRIKLLIIFITLLANCGLGDGISAYVFDTIGLDDGLSQSGVTSIVKDKYGFIWLGTEDGLDRFDGVSFKNFKNDPNDSSSINSNTILASIIDQRGDMWIGTYLSGLNKYDYSQENFIRYSDELLTAEEGPVYALLEDHSGYIWIGTSESGLFRMDPRSGKIQALQTLLTNSTVVSDTLINALYEDHEKQLWICTQNGLNVLDLSTYQLKSYFYDENDPHSLFDNTVNTVYETFDGSKYTIWVGTIWGGFDRFDPQNDSFIHHGYNSKINPDFPETGILTMIQENDSCLWLGTDSEGILLVNPKGELQGQIKRKVYDKFALKDDIIQKFYDDGDIIWIGTSGGGVSKYARNRKKFYNLSYDPLNPAGLHDDRILRIAIDSKGDLWIATWTEGITRYSPQSNEFRVFKHNPSDESSLSDNSIQDILIDSNDNLWVISDSKSLDLLRSGSDTFEHLYPRPKDPNWFHTEYLLNLAEDHDGLIWMGSWDEGLISLDPTTMKFSTFTEASVNDVSLGSIAFYIIFEDSNGILWIGAENDGLIGFDRKTNSLKQFKSNPDDPASLAHDDVVGIYEDSQGYLWLSTYGGGLSKFDPVQETFENFGSEHGLKNQSVYTVFEDANSQLWMSTNDGISRFDQASKTFKNYGSSDGVLSKEFNPAYAMDKNGWIYFGGVKGITYFDPLTIKDNANVPIVQFTDLSIMNQAIDINSVFNGREVLNRTITEVPFIELYPDDLFFTLRFASLDYYHSKRNEYSYQLVGFDDTWHHIGNRQSITFANLPPGHYTLEVKGSNNDGLWNEDATTLDVIIRPDFYETWWFISLCIVFVGIVAFVAYSLRTSFLIRRAKEFEQHNIQLNAQIESRREAHRVARERADYFRAVISQSPIPMAIHDIEGNITHLNIGWVKLWDADGPEEIIRDYQIQTDTHAKQLNLFPSFKKALLGNIVEHPEVQLNIKGKGLKIMHILLYPLKEKSGSTNQVMILIEDVTESVQYREVLQKSLSEKELLLREVHHRVKNNLQIITSLLGLQMAGVDDQEKNKTLLDFRNRVNSMAQVHDALYRSPEFDNIDIGNYIGQLTDELMNAFQSTSEAISINTEIPSLTLSVDIAVPCGLIINELVTNALKYAFPANYGKEKLINIRFKELEDDLIRLDVSDNGIGFQHAVEWESVKSLGLFLVKILSEHQLMGTVNVYHEEGSRFVIEFPLHPDFD